MNKSIFWYDTQHRLSIQLGEVSDVKDCSQEKRKVDGVELR